MPAASARAYYENALGRLETLAEVVTVLLRRERFRLKSARVIPTLSHFRSVHFLELRYQNQSMNGRTFACHPKAMTQPHFGATHSFAIFEGPYSYLVESQANLDTSASHRQSQQDCEVGKIEEYLIQTRFIAGISLTKFMVSARALLSSHRERSASKSSERLSPREIDEFLTTQTI
jgi:hypothetical protein